ncbi:MAG: bifunctional N(6)-L-threonylcarbamoyladenine synthase/serine/threonine protein kinase [Candidatus Diapherotrites archaeon]|nr:bifunctional N(6)-L-threonylcarbamoyladenine synthase/serine/threonine protein kinase [Candidatus Diapherotrites archaeon]
MICLGIESTAHTFGCGIVDEHCNILANEKKSFTSKYTGIKPAEVSDFHYKNSINVIKTALEKASLKIEDIDLISFSQGPGIGQCLKVGSTTARFLALKFNKPIIGVNHCVAHIEIGIKLCKCKDPIAVYVSGANTQIIGFESKYYRVYGETIDIGIGNLLDSFGRYINIGFPAGPLLDKMYFEAEKYIELPYSVKGMDLVFSGLLTAARNKIGECKKEDLSYSLLHNAFAMIAEVSERALSHTGKKEILLTGGVAASNALQDILKKMCKQRGAELKVTPKEVATDNGAMIAWLGILEYSAGKRMKIEETKINPKYRTDHVKVIWR